MVSQTAWWTRPRGTIEPAALKTADRIRKRHKPGSLRGRSRACLRISASSCLVLPRGNLGKGDVVDHVLLTTDEPATAALHQQVPHVNPIALRGNFRVPQE